MNTVTTDIKRRRNNTVVGVGGVVVVVGVVVSGVGVLVGGVVVGVISGVGVVNKKRTLLVDEVR